MNKTDEEKRQDEERQNQNGQQPDQVKAKQELLDATDVHTQSEAELRDNEAKADRQLEELSKSNADHTSDDYHTADAIEEQKIYEKGQRVQREQEEKLNSNS